MDFAINFYEKIKIRVTFRDDETVEAKSIEFNLN